jgi:uncharacterized membrane protein YgaE (UPF0421/DUF939 family)
VALTIAESTGADMLTTSTTRVVDTALGAAVSLLVLVVEPGAERLLAHRRSAAPASAGNEGSER